MSDGSLSLEYSIAQSQPAGSGSSSSYSFESGFTSVIAQDYSRTTPPSVLAPAISGPVVGFLLVGMLVIVLVSLVRNRSYAPHLEQSVHSETATVYFVAVGLLNIDVRAFGDRVFRLLSFCLPVIPNTSWFFGDANAGPHSSTG